MTLLLSVMKSKSFRQLLCLYRIRKLDIEDGEELVIYTDKEEKQEVLHTESDSESAKDDEQGVLTSIQTTK